MRGGVLVAAEVLEHGWDVFDRETMADYNASFEGKVPVLLGIGAYQKGHGYGYVVMHQFLEEVYREHSYFYTTMLLLKGQRLLKKLVDEGLIKQVPHNDPGVTYPNKFVLLKDPRENLRAYVEGAQRPIVVRKSTKGVQRAVPYI